MLKMKKTLLFFVPFLIVFYFQSFCQNNIGIQWERTFGGSKNEKGAAIIKTNDGGFITASTAESSDGDLGAGNRDSGDVWVIKFNVTGAIDWKKTYGSSKAEETFDIIQTADGGYMVLANTKGNDGDVSGLKGKTDIWVFKINQAGLLQWQRCLGGTNTDFGYSISESQDGGVVITGTTASNNGDVVGKLDENEFDVWIVKLNNTGNLVLWQKIFKGSKFDWGNDIVSTSDGGYVITGSTQSNDLDFSGNGTGNNAYEDMFIIRLDNNGNTLWKKMYHSEAGDLGFGVIQTPDNGFLVAGSRGAYSRNVQPGGSDFFPAGNAWIVKTNASGDIAWQKIINNTSDTFSFLQDPVIDISNNGYIFSGTVVSNQFLLEAWIVKSDLNGNIIWQKKKSGLPNLSSKSVRLIQNTNQMITAIGLASQQSDNNMLLFRVGPVNQAKGIVFFDANSNNIKDPGEQNFNNAIVKSQKGSSIITGQPQNGFFRFDIDTGSYTTTVQLFNPYFNVVPFSRNTNFTTYFNVDSFGFAIQPIPNKQDLIVHFVPASPARPGFKAQYVLNYKNVGTTTIANGSVKLIKDSRTTLTAALPVPSTIIADTLTWNYSNLKPLDSVAIGLEFQLAPPPALNINDTLKYTAVILPVAGDLTPADDTSSLRQRVIGSYDPNDKQESFAGKIPMKSVQDGSYINYVIRFQNTGNDTAFFVRLLDTLDTKLDWNSFQMIGSSHAYNLTIKDGNKLNWFFDNIKLPDSTTNLARSIGYVAFRIKPKNTLMANEVIRNKASIYFDYNLPIVTNTTNTVVSVEIATAVREVQNDEMKMKLGPNPSNGYSVLQISGKLNGKFELRMIDANGRIISQQTITRNSTGEIIRLPLNLQQLSSGVYMIQLQQKEKSWWQKIVLQ